MIFKAQPNLFVRLSNKYVQRVTGKKGFYFDENGLYETENEILCKLLAQNFETIEEKQEAKVEETPKKHCKKCEFTCENQGDLLAHYRTTHKKED
jgi:hypothetical protein